MAGTSMTMVISLIIAVVVIYSGTQLYASTTNKAKYLDWKVQCSTSVADAQAVAEKKQLESDIICPTYKLTSKAETKKDTMREMAQSLWDCWSIFRQGSVNILSWDIHQTNYCVICQTTSFPKKYTFSVEEFIEYTKTAKPAGINATFHELLTNEKRLNLSEISAGDNFDTSQVYDTVFTYSRDVDYENPTGQRTTEIASYYPVVNLQYHATAYVMRQIFSTKDAAWESGLAYVPTDAVKLQRIKCDHYPLRQYSEGETNG